MSVDISQMAMTARLDPERQAVVKSQYEECETNPTAAYLLCFFLGSAGAHRFYLKEWRVGFAHLALFLLGAVSLIFGLTQTLPLTSQLASHPVGAALDTLGVLLLLAALIWEIIDLGRIDEQVYQRNLLIAEGIIGANLLAEKDGADAAAQGAESTATYPVAGGAASAAGVITASEVADARALAEETGGRSNIAYSSASPYEVSGATDQAAAATEPVAPPTPYAVEQAPASSAADAAGLGAAALGAGALGAAAWGAAQPSSFDEPTQPDLTPIFTEEAAPAPMATEASPADTLPATPLGAYDFSDEDLGDVTDASMPAIVAPTADIAYNNASPAYVSFPDDEEPAAATFDEPAAPLYITPEEAPTASYPYAQEEPPMATYPYAPEPNYPPAPSYAPPAEANVPPVPSVFSADTQPPAATTPGWDQPTATRTPPDQPSTLAEAAGVAGVGAFAAGALAQERAPEPAPERVVAEPVPAPQPRRIRVKRAAILDGKVIGEMVVVGEVLPGETPQDAFDRIQAEMAHYSPEQIAQAANLSPEDQVQIHQGDAG